MAHIAHPWYDQVVDAYWPAEYYASLCEEVVARVLDSPEMNFDSDAAASLALVSLCENDVRALLSMSRSGAVTPKIAALARPGLSVSFWLVKTVLFWAEPADAESSTYLAARVCPTAAVWSSAELDASELEVLMPLPDDDDDAEERVLESVEHDIAALFSVG